MTGWRLLLTRPAEDSAQLAALLDEHGVHCSSLPLLAIAPLPETPEQRATMLELDHYRAVVVVSKPAARAALELLDRCWPQPPTGPRWFSVGGGTGAILRNYGLDAFWPSEGDDSEALLSLPDFIETLAAPGAKVLIVRGEGGREYLADTLRARGVQVDSLALYRRYLPPYPPRILIDTIQAERLNGLVVSSGQGLQSLRELAGDAWVELSGLPLFVPSPRVANQARELGAKKIVDCRGAGTAALLTALRDAPQPPSDAKDES